ncbi:hypothetical protein VQ056_25350 [Paenibacillus sp. JTLBN-2024]
MSDLNIRLNYHSFLEEIKNDFDPIIKKMREQDFDGWRGQAWKGPLKKLKNTFKSAGTLAKIKWAGLPLIGPVIAGVGGYLAHIPLLGHDQCSGVHHHDHLLDPRLQIHE